MYITDRDKHQVMMFTTEGEFLKTLDHSENQSFIPLVVAVDKTGNVYVCTSKEVLVSKP